MAKINKEIEASLLVDSMDVLGESNLWDSRTGFLYWVDIDGYKIHRCRETGEDVESMVLEEKPCSLALMEDPKHFLVAVESGVDIFEWGVGPMRRVWDYPDRPEGVRLNDGRCDRQGRFIFGGYHPRNADDTESGKLARVFRLDKDFTGQPLFGDLRVRVTNSICFSPDGCTMYFCDSPDRKLLAYEYETATGVPKNPKLLRDFGADNLGFPDGSTVDSQGGIWTTVFGGWKVQRHDPQTGEADWTVKLPVPNPTCVAIGGENMDLLFITTTRKRMIADQLLKMPTSGGVFVVKLPGNSRGIHEPIFGVQ